MSCYLFFILLLQLCSNNNNKKGFTQSHKMYETRVDSVKIGHGCDFSEKGYKFQTNKS